MKERFKPYRDKEIPEDYSVDLSPREGRYVGAISAAHSPSGEVIAVLAGNRREAEYDVVLISAKDGEVIRNLTPGYAGEFINVVGLSGEDQLIGRNLRLDPRRRSGRLLRAVPQAPGAAVRRRDRLEDRAAHRDPAGPGQVPAGGSPTGGGSISPRSRDGIGDIYRIDLETEEIENLTRDDFHDKFPTPGPNGEWLYYSRRISGYDKLYRLRLADGAKEQLTFGLHNDTAPIFAPNGRDIVYSSDEDDGIFNVRTLDIETGDIVQYTPMSSAATSRRASSPTPDTGADTLLFTSYHKGNWGLYRLAMDEPVREMTADQIARTDGPVIDFVPNVNHQVISENKREKTRFERLFLDGPPPIQAGVTSDGDFFGGSAISFSDVLGDDRFSFTAYSVRSFRVYDVQYANLASRLQYAVEAHDRTSFFYPQLPYYFGSFYSRADRLGTIRMSGTSVRAMYPLSRFRRIEMGVGYDYQRSGFQNIYLQPGSDGLLSPDLIDNYSDFYSRIFPNGHLLPVRGAFVQETIRFRQVGPAVFPQAGSTIYAGVEWSPGGPFLSRTTFNLDARKYFQVTSASVLAARLRWFHSVGEAPGFFWFGGNGELRGYDLYSFTGNRGGHATVEFRFPIIDAAITPIGLIGPLRGSFFNRRRRGGVRRGSARLLLLRAARVPARVPLRPPEQLGLRVRGLRARRLRGLVGLQRPRLSARAAAQRFVVEADRLRYDGSRLALRFLDGLALLGGWSPAAVRNLEAAGMIPRRAQLQPVGARNGWGRGGAVRRIQGVRLAAVAPSTRSLSAARPWIQRTAAGARPGPSCFT